MLKKGFQDFKSLKIFKSALFHKKYMHFCPNSPTVSQNWLVLSGIKHINNIILFLGNFHESICLLLILKSTENKIIFVLWTLYTLVTPRVSLDEFYFGQLTNLMYGVGEKEQGCGIRYLRFDFQLASCNLSYLAPI